jgi:hypothetical protein
MTRKVCPHRAVTDIGAFCVFRFFFCKRSKPDESKHRFFFLRSAAVAQHGDAGIEFKADEENGAVEL